MGKKLAALGVVVVIVASCTAGPNTVVDTAGVDGDIAGFWLGLWHGLIAGITFIISLFTDKVHMYEVHNNGAWYDLGFVLGAGILFGGSTHASRRRKRKSTRLHAPVFGAWRMARSLGPCALGHGCLLARHA